MPPDLRRGTGRRALLSAAGVLAAGLGLAGCQTPPRRAFSTITFANRPPIRLNVASVEVVDPPPADPSGLYVQDQFPQTPASVLRGWAAERLRPVGAGGAARFVIEEASVLEEALALTPGVRGRFTLDQSERYTLTYRVRVEAFQPSTGASGVATAEAIRSVTVREDVTLAQRERTWFNLLESATADLDGVLEQNIRTYLAPFIVA